MSEKIKYWAANGWTKEKIKEVIRRRPNTYCGKRNPGNIETPNMCFYRGDGNQRCVAGAFIPDSEYFPEIERVPIRNIMYRYPRIGALMPLDGGGMQSLQSIHDDSEPGDPDINEKCIDWVDEYVADPV